MFLLKAVLNIFVSNVSPRGPMCFRWLIFNLAGPCKLLFYCVCVCACDPNERLNTPSICFVCVLYVGSYLLI